LTYAEFIKEIRRLAGEGDSILAARFTHEARPFRDWRYVVEGTVSNAESLGFKLPGEFESDARHYRAMYDATPQQNQEAFVRDLGDSLTELRFLISHFDKYGAPVGQGERDAAAKGGATGCAGKGHRPVARRQCGPGWLGRIHWPDSRVAFRRIRGWAI